MRSKFTKTSPNTVTHTGISPWTNQHFTRRYWVPMSGGTVYVDSSPSGDRPGTLGKAVYTNGSVWSCAPDDLLSIVKREWRIEKRLYAIA